MINENRRLTKHLKLQHKKQLKNIQNLNKLPDYSETNRIQSP